MSFIKIDREILDSYCFANPNHLKVWLWLLIKANYKDAFVSLKMGKGFTTVEIKRGQLLFGRFKAEEELGLDGSMIYRALKKFEDLDQINIEANNLYSIITICKYDSYQGYDSDDEQPMSSERTTNEQQVKSQRKANEQQVNTSKEELEEIRRIKNNKEHIPNEVEFLLYCKEVIENDLKAVYEEYEFSLKAKYQTWVDAGWKDGYGKPIKVWKSKIKNTFPHLKKTYIKSNPEISQTRSSLHGNQDFINYSKRMEELKK
jgi:hypothetical protein